jgi:bile acid:Na+ symporter, BASS family
VHIVDALLKLSIVMLAFGLGLRATPDEFTRASERSRLVVRSLAAVHVLIPLLGALIVVALAMPKPQAIALLLVAVSPVAPRLVSYTHPTLGPAVPEVGITVASCLLGTVTIPVSLAIMNAVVIDDASISPLGIARLLGVLLLLPLTIGAILQEITVHAARLGRLVIAGSTAVFVVAVALVLTSVRLNLLALNLQAFPALVALATGVLAIGHLVAPSDADRPSLAMTSAARHLGLALLIAVSNFPPESAAIVVLEYLVASTLVTAPYVIWQRHRGRGVILAESPPVQTVGGTDP